jgi:tetratricopeptide (TPR) repeat protein
MQILELASRISGKETLALQSLCSSEVWNAAGLRIYPFNSSGLSEAYLRAGYIEKAASHAERALEFSRNHQERGREAWILRQLEKIHARRNHSDVDRIEFYYRQALKQAEELKMRPLIAHSHLSLGELYTQIEQGDRARKELSTAIDLYRSME